MPLADPVVPEILDLEKLLELFDRHTGISNTLWGFFSTVALAGLGFAYKDGAPVSSDSFRKALTFGFALFAAGNGIAMFRTSRTLYHLGILIRAQAIEHPRLADFLTSHVASGPWWIALSQFLFFLGVLAAIWIPRWWSETPSAG